MFAVALAFTGERGSQLRGRRRQPRLANQVVLALTGERGSQPRGSHVSSLCSPDRGARPHRRARIATSKSSSTRFKRFWLRPLTSERRTQLGAIAAILHWRVLCPVEADVVVWGEYGQQVVVEVGDAAGGISALAGHGGG